MTHEVREQVSGEQVLFGRKCRRSNCHWGASVAGANVWGATVIGEQLSLGRKCRGIKCRGSKCLGSNCYWGTNVRGANVPGAIVWGAPFVLPMSTLEQKLGDEEIQSERVGYVPDPLTNPTEHTTADTIPIGNR